MNSERETKIKRGLGIGLISAGIIFGGLHGRDIYLRHQSEKESTNKLYELVVRENETPTKYQFKLGSGDSLEVVYNVISNSVTLTSASSNGLEKTITKHTFNSKNN